MPPIIQIAGILDQKEAELIVSAGATHLGFPLGPGVKTLDLSENAATDIISKLPSTVTPVLITYLKTCDAVLALADKLGCQAVQLHGEIIREEVEKLKTKRPQLFVMKSLVVAEKNLDELIGQVAELDPLVDAYITDTFDPDTGARGATGKIHDWSVSRHLVEISKRPVVLAGGLNERNVAQAISEVQPAGVDVHTGIEGPDGRKLPQKLEEFIRVSRQEMALRA